jgi:hypothetical protein
MRQFALLLSLVVLLCGCSKNESRNSVIGKWIDKPTGESTIEFKSDGTAIMNTDFVKKRARMISMNPGKTQQVDSYIRSLEPAVASLNAVGLTWKKEGDFYVLSAPMTHGFMSYKLEGGKLVAYADGKNPSLAFVPYLSAGK